MTKRISKYRVVAILDSRLKAFAPHPQKSNQELVKSRNDPPQNAISWEGNQDVREMSL